MEIRFIPVVSDRTNISSRSQYHFGFVVPGPSTGTACVWLSVHNWDITSPAKLPYAWPRNAVWIPWSRLMYQNGRRLADPNRFSGQSCVALLVTMHRRQADIGGFLVFLGSMFKRTVMCRHSENPRLMHSTRALVTNENFAYDTHDVKQTHANIYCMSFVRQTKWCMQTQTKRQRLESIDCEN